MLFVFTVPCISLAGKRVVSGHVIELLSVLVFFAEIVVIRLSFQLRI